MARPKPDNPSDHRHVAVYARKSKVTETGKSIEIQKEKCIELASIQFGASKSELLIYQDEGKSGFYADRPQYRKMLRDIEANKIKAVICYKIDRISRRTIDLLNLVQQMEQKGIAFVSVSDRELDTSTRTGKIMISLLSAIAEFERDIIAERITDNMYELAKEGRWLGGECPLGYCSKKETQSLAGRKTHVNHLAPVEREQQAVKMLFEIFLRTGSLTATATALSNQGFRTKREKEFTSIAVKNILQNPVYAVADEVMRNYLLRMEAPIWAEEKDFDNSRGIMAYNKTEQTKEINRDSRTLDPKYTQKTTRRDIREWIIAVGRHKGIVSGGDWIRAQNILEEISRTSAARPKEVSKALLSGLVRCNQCGGPMFVRPETGRYNPDGTVRFGYRCDAKYRKKSGGCEGSPNIKGYALDNFVVEQICNLGRAALKDFYIQLLGTKDTLLLKSMETRQERQIFTNRLRETQINLRSQAANLRTAPSTAKEAIYADIEALSRERAEIQESLDAICRRTQAQDLEAAEGFRESLERHKETITDFSRLMETLSYGEKLRLLREILEYVTVEDGRVHIFFKKSIL